MSESTVHWQQDGQEREARWLSASGMMAPARVVTADDTMKADVAFRLASEGTALLWQGDYHNARQLLQAMARRIDRKPRKPAPAESAFNLYRQAQGQRARTLNMLLLPFDESFRIPLRRAPDVAQACHEAYGPVEGGFVTSLRELLGIIGAHEWRRKGVHVPALDARIHPHYGVFAPVRGEYVELVAKARLPATDLAFDIGTGTGVLAAVLARRGLKVVATDQSPAALACARDNLARLGLEDQVDVQCADIFPEGRAGLIVCNPPWLPARPGSALEAAVYDPGSRMLNGFLQGLAAHLAPGGEGWLIMSDIAEHLQLRSRQSLLDSIEQAGLVVLDRHDTRPVHGKATDANDPLHQARAAEVTSLWRLGAARG